MRDSDNSETVGTEKLNGRPHGQIGSVRPARGGSRITVADLIAATIEPPLTLRVTAYDGTDIGPADAALHLNVESEIGLRYLITAPGDLGLARAYITGNLTSPDVHPGDPYEAFAAIKRIRTHRPPASELARLLRGLGISGLKPPPPPPQETPPRWRRTLNSMQRRAGRAADAISHHYDVSNNFYEYVLGPSMTYTCAVYADQGETLEVAQARKYELVAQKLALKPGQRLLDVGCGWGGMVRHAARHHGVRALGVTLSREQAAWAQAQIESEGLSDRAEVRHLDVNELTDSGFDAISSIGLTEHIGVRRYHAYFAMLAQKLVPGGRLLNHCITRADSHAEHRPEPFTDRYVFPDGELAAPGRVISEAHDAGLEVHHCENLRMHYAYTLAGWNSNLKANWDNCVAEAGEGKSKVWGIYLAGSRFSFESNWLQLHQVLCSKPEPGGATSYPLRPDWDSSPTVR